MSPPTHDPQDKFTPPAGQIARPAGADSLKRLEDKLWSNEAAVQHLLGGGLSAETVRKFHLGIKEPPPGGFGGETDKGVLCYPLISYSGEALRHYSYFAFLEGLKGAHQTEAWGPGKPRTYYSGNVAGKSILLVADGTWQLWALDQHLRGTDLGRRAAIVCSSHGLRIPGGWKWPEFWAGWAAVYFAHSNTEICEQAAHTVLRHCGCEVFRLRPPGSGGPGWDDFFRAGGTAGQFAELLECAPVFTDPAPKNADDADPSGEFAVSPVNINGAFVNGHLYYPFTIERREVEEVERSGVGKVRRLVSSYVTKVVR